MRYFKLYKTWDVAHKQGHFAFKLLAIAKKESDKVADFENQIAKVKRTSVEYLTLTAKRDFTEEQFYQFISGSVILFQSMMEAIINDSLENEDLLALVEVTPNGKFREKWITSLNELNQDLEDFDKYFYNIYKTFRYFIVHPEEKNLGKLNNIKYNEINEGFKSGWKAYELLYKGLGHPHDENSWEIMSDIYR